MKHKRLLVFCSCLLAAGMVLSGIGLILGGRPWQWHVLNGQLYYQNGTQSYAAGQAPSWMNYWSTSFFGWGGLFAGEYYPEQPETPQKPGKPGKPEAPNGISAANLQKLDIDIAAGYVNIVVGEEPGLTVEGEMSYTNTFKNGEWKIKVPEKGLVSRLVDGVNRFFLNGRDVTTTFTITVPQNLPKLEAELDMGVLTLTDIAAQELDLSVDMGNLTAKNCSASNSSFDVGMGNAKVDGFAGKTGKMKVNMGKIDFTGNITDSLDVECDRGTIKATLPRPQNYSWDAKLDMGTIKIDGKSIGHGGPASGSQGEQGATPYFNLDCGMGTIELSFSN